MSMSTPGLQRRSRQARIAVGAAIAVCLLTACGSELSHSQLAASQGAIEVGSGQQVTTGTGVAATGPDVAGSAGSVGSGGSAADTTGTSGDGTATVPTATTTGAPGNSAGASTGAGVSNGAVQPGTSTVGGSGGTSAGTSTANGKTTSGGASAKPSAGASKAAAPTKGKGAAPTATQAAGGTAVNTAANTSPMVFCSFGNSAGALGAVSGPAPVANVAWADYVNAHGGLAGHPVKMIIADDGGDSSKALAIAQNCVEQQHAIAIFNEFTFGEISGAPLQYLEGAGVPVVGSIGAALDSDHSADIFNPLTGADTGQAWGFIDTINAQTQNKKLGILYCQEAPTCQQQVDTFSKLLPYNGINVVFKQAVSLAQPDFTGPLLQAQNAGANVIVALVDSASLGRMVKNAASQSYKPVFVGTYNLALDATLQQGSVLNGLVLASRTPPYTTSPLSADYRQAMAQYEPGQPLGDVGSGAFVNGDLLSKLAPTFFNKPTVTSADVTAAMRSLHGETLGGLLPGITFPAGGDHTGVNECIFPIMLMDGKFQQNGNLACAPGWKPGT